jgi:hypothetical protein
MAMIPLHVALSVLVSPVMTMAPNLAVLVSESGWVSWLQVVRLEVLRAVLVACLVVVWVGLLVVWILRVRVVSLGVVVADDVAVLVELHGWVLWVVVGSSGLAGFLVAALLRVLGVARLGVAVLAGVDRHVAG